MGSIVQRNANYVKDDFMLTLPLILKEILHRTAVEGIMEGKEWYGTTVSKVEKDIEGVEDGSD